MRGESKLPSYTIVIISLILRVHRYRGMFEDDLDTLGHERSRRFLDRGLGDSDWLMARLFLRILT